MGLVWITTWPLSGLVSSVGEDQVRCNGGLGRTHRQRSYGGSARYSSSR
jgi:hypothetical protein